MVIVCDSEMYTKTLMGGLLSCVLDVRYSDHLDAGVSEARSAEVVE